MKRALLILIVGILVSGSIGCTHRNQLRQGCTNCDSGSRCGIHGLIGCRSCGNARTGTMCRPGMLGWQRGGTDYIPRLPPGTYGHNVGFQGQPGPQTPTYRNPYYTTRAPRDFFLDDPPTIGR